MSLAKASINRSVSDSDCDGEEYLISVDDNKPPSPLSVQYDGVSLPVQSPPFENGSNEKPSSTLSDCSNPVDLDVDGEFTTNKDVDCAQPCPLITWVSDGHQVFQKASVEPVVSTVPEHEGAATTKNGSSGNVHEINSTEELSSHQPAKISSPRRMPVKKSVQQLYGQPSWWGDGEDNYSYPHTSLLGTKETAEMEEKSVSSVNTPIAEQDVKPHPRSEAFVIDFGPTRSASESRGPVPGSLSQCVPDRLRRGFVERERLKREREKENELRRQTMSTECGPVRQNSQRSTRSVTLRAANAKLTASAGGRPATAKIGTGGRGLHSPKARPSTATPGRGRGGGPTRRPAPLDTTAQSVRTTSQGSLTPRRTAGSLPTSPLVRASKTTGSVSVTPRHTNPATTRDLLGGAISRVTALQAVTTRTGLTMARRSTAVGMITSSTPRKLSQGTERSVASRRTAPAPVSTTRPRGTTGTTAGRTGTTGTRVASKPTTTGRTRGGLQTRESVTRGFMSATASSGAKRVQPNSSSSRPPTGSTAHPYPRQSAGTVGPAPVNSVKRPITSTQLRCRPASSTRTTTCRPLTNPPEKRGSARPHGSLHRTMSEVTANMMATMEAYGDPKAYLFYRMFQGADEAEPSTDSVFKTFTSESPIRSAGPKRGLTVGAIPQADFDVALAQTEWLRSYPDQEETMQATTTLSPDPGLPSPIQFDPEGDGKLFTTNTSQVPFCSNHAPGVAPEGKKTKPVGSHIHDATKPTASDSSPVMQHRQTSRHNNNQLSSSMLVGTSVTSLAGTYILEKGSVLLDTGIENGSQNLTTSLGRPHEQDPTDQLHLRTNLARLQETEEEQNGPESESLRRASKPSPTSLINLADSDSQMPGRRSPTTYRLGRRLNNAPPGLAASIDLPTNKEDPCVRPGSMAIDNAHCSMEMMDACKDDLEVKKNGAQTQSAEGLNASMLIGESVTSLAPSVAATYVLDVDETLAAQGLVPAVVIQSQENLLLSPTREIRLIGSRLVSHGTCFTEMSKESSLTPRASPTLNREELWGVLEAEECTEDAEGQNHSRKGGTLSRTGYANPEDGDADTPEELEVDTVEEVDCYRPLPNPSTPRDQDLEGRTHRTHVNNDNIILNSTLPAASPSQTGRSALDAAITYDSLRQTNSNAVESQYSPAPAGSGTRRGPGVALERPDRSPSNSSTPPTAGTIPDGLAVTTSSSSLTASLFRAVDGDQLSSPKPCSSSELHSRPRSTYAPLSDIHNCYRALQQSMNYLIQSQTGLLPDAEYAGYNNNDDDSNTIAFDLPAVSSFNTEYGNLPVRIGQTSGAVGVHLTHVTDCRVPCSSAAVWPPDLTHKNSTGVRRSLSRQNRADRQRQSTASLDSALHRWDDSQTEIPQLKQRSFRGPKSGRINSTQKAFHEYSETWRLSSALDQNAMASGDFGLQSYSTSLSQPDRKSHQTITMDQLNQLAQTYRSQSLRTGFASVPEPASPTGSGSSPVTNGWCSTRRPQPLPDMNLSVPPTSGDVPTTGTHPMRAMNPLNRTYDFSAQNGPQVLSHDLHAGICDPSMGKDHLPVSGRGPCVLVSTSNGLTKGNGTTELPTFDSRTFTRRKGVLPASTDPNSASAFDPSSYEALVAGMSAISQGIDSLSRAPLFRSAIESSLSQTGTKRNGSASDLPDSTTGPPYPNEPIRSAFVTPIPQRTLCRNSGPLETELSRTDQVPEDPTEAATYYTLMVNSIRHLSLKLRQCSDKLVQRVNAEQSVSPLNVALNMDRRTSRASSTDSVPTSTKFALTDALENMRMISQQLQAVDQLFSQGWNEKQQQQTAPSQADLSGYTRQVDSNHFSFLPIDRIESSSLKNSRTLLPGLQTRSTTARVLRSGAQLTPKSGPSAFVLPGQVPPQMQTLKPPMDEEDEYY
ncbi:hypothetical protein FGIG_04484 [Fasciola gigantica]|uniref:Uncharacterized protein n=1 Tax=Fasciola gigantica TaxID=46835 RepID=A0A504YEH1_FASGI|nr:hypothetical protein FGIG_04484 [Fasciola gigantica]